MCKGREWDHAGESDWVGDHPTHRDALRARGGARESAVFTRRAAGGASAGAWMTLLA